MNEWKVTFNRPAFGDYVDMYIFRYVSDGECELLSRDSKGNQIIIKVHSYESTVHITPTLRLNGNEQNQILKALAEGIDAQGIKTDSDAKISGLLEATKAHLEDMRNLVFRKEEHA